MTTVSGNKSRAKSAILFLVTVLSLVGLTQTQGKERAFEVPAGFDLFETDPNTTEFRFTGPFAIPPKFFDARSKLFRGVVCLEGVPIGSFQGQDTGTADTIVRRGAPANLRARNRDNGTIPIELVALSLRSCEPIEVRVRRRIQLWDVRVEVSPGRPSTGEMTVFPADSLGGTFSSALAVYPRFTFTRRSDGAERVLDLGARHTRGKFKGLDKSSRLKRSLTLRATNVPWVHTCPPGVLVVPGWNDDFCASATPDARVLTVEQARNASHGIRPALADRFVEHDHFEDTEAEFTLVAPDGTEETISLRGPAWVDVWFERLEGEAQDDDGDGRDEVSTEIVQLDLVGGSSIGPVQVRLNPSLPTVGEIEELANANPGRLDLDPFHPGNADSFFDVFFEIEVGGMVLHNEEPKRLSTVITHKPPSQGEVYESLQTIPLFDADGNPTGFSLGSGRHEPNPEPFVEHDHFEDTEAGFTLVAPDGTEETIELRGPAWVDVWFERLEGEAQDDDGDGRDEVVTRIQQLDLTGDSSMGPVQVRLNPNLPSMGEIEELANAHPGWLDLDPFHPGDAESFFDVFFEIEVGGMVLHNEEPKRLSTVIAHKPPSQGDVYESVQTIPLFDADGNLTGFSLGSGRHVPTPGDQFVEHDHFEDTEAEINLVAPDGTEETIELRGPAWVDVWFELLEGEAQDDDADGRDEVSTEIVQLDLVGTSSLGVVRVRLNPNLPSTGEIEELANAHPGRLDLDPFHPGDADSFFDVFFEIEVGGMVLHNEEPKRLSTVITHKPPSGGDAYESLQTIPLFDEDGNPTGFSLGSGRHEPNPEPFVEHDHFEDTEAEIDLVAPDGTQETISLRGPAWVDVWFERREGEAQDDDGDGRDEVSTEIVQLDLAGGSSIGPVQVRLNPNLPSLGEIEERANAHPGWLDLDPFHPGDAESFFDVFFEIEVGGMVLHNEQPKRLSTVITHKPPSQGDVYESLQTIPLFDADGNPTGFYLGSGRHEPNPEPFVEHDQFTDTEARVFLIGPDGGQEEIELRGPVWVDVWFERLEGEAQDDDGDGRDEVRTEMVLLDLVGDSSMGEVKVRLNPNLPSPGEIEEQANRRPGRLDLDPFHPGEAESFFDIFFEIEVGGLVLHNEQAKRLSALITHKPPAQGDVYESQQTIPLLDANGNASGFSLGSGRHVPVPQGIGAGREDKPRRP